MSENEQQGREEFLARWLRRKELARKGEPLPEPGEEADDGPAQAAADEEQAADTGAELPAEADAAPPEADEEVELPPLESLDENSDYSAFLRDGVPEETRQKALRKLFHSPKFNVRDGLDDYDWDMTKPQLLGDVITAEMRYRMRRELERLAGLDEDEEEPRDSPDVTLADSREHDEPDQQTEAEADDERPEPS